MTGTIYSEAGTAYPSGASESSPFI